MASCRFSLFYPDRRSNEAHQQDSGKEEGVLQEEEESGVQMYGRRPVKHSGLFRSSRLQYVELCCLKLRQWPSSDKQSHNHPGPADTLGTNSKPVFAHDEGLAVWEMMEYVEGVEEGKMEKKAEEKVAEAQLGVLYSLEGMPWSCLSQEAEPQSPTIDEHKPRPDGSSAEGQIKVTDRIAGQKKVFRKRQKAKPKMQTAEAAGTEGGPRNTRAPFRFQDFVCFKISKHTVLFLLVLLAFPVNSNETPKQRMCAVCLEKDCATGVRIIYPASSDIPVWVKANSQTGIQNCSMENLKADAPCKMANGSLVQPANEMLHFDGIDPYVGRRVFRSQISPCADLNLPPKPSPVADKKDRLRGITIVMGILNAFCIIVISIGVLIVKCCSHGEAQVILTNRMVREREVSSRKRKKVEYRPTEGGPRNTLASFHLQFIALLLLLAPSVNSTEAPKPGTQHTSSTTPSTASLGMCAVCLEKDCATRVEKINPAGSDTAVWSKANSPTGIQNCSKENLKSDAPCKMANGSLAQLADLAFDGIDTYGVRRPFHSQISPCADLNLPPSSTPSPAPIHNTSPPAATNNSVADNKDSIGSRSGIGVGIVIGICIGIGIGFLIWRKNIIFRLYNCIRGLYRGRRQGTWVPPHDAEHRDEITIETHSNVKALAGPLRG